MTGGAHSHERQTIRQRPVHCQQTGTGVLAMSIDENWCLAMNVPSQVTELVDRFYRNRDIYRSGGAGGYNET
jgi:tartrate dehydratase alpha subunit/fumarate hydratase class I-like protein